MEGFESNHIGTVLMVTLHASAGGSRGSQGPIAAGRGRAERLRSFGREVWAPYLADTLLRVFASASISGQIGRFTRPMFDYTAGSVRTQTYINLSERHGSSGLPAGEFNHIYL